MWTSGRQTIVTMPTTEAEYVVACKAAKEAVWLRQLLESLNCTQNGATVLLEDNNGCIAQTENPLHHKRTKHVDVYYHYTRQMVEEGVLILEKIATEDQTADLLTKPLGNILFVKH